MPLLHLAHPAVAPLVICFILAYALIPAHAERHDLVIMNNGDHLSGKLKKLENGILYFSVPYVSDSIQLDWLQVQGVKSTDAFEVVLKNGSHLAGTITKVPSQDAPGQDFQVRAGNHAIHASGKDVINIESRKPNVWRQLTGSIDIGSDFTSGNSQTSFSSDASASYLATSWAAGASLTSSFSGQSSGSQTNLLELQGLGERYMSHNSSVLGLADFLHSSQQDLQLRSTLGGGYSRYFLRSNNNLLRWILGPVYTRETFVTRTREPTDQNIEALLGAQYQLLRFSRYNLQSQLFVFPGLSDTGRIRTTTKTTLNVKLPNNFHTNLSFWDNYDSRPPVNAKKNELGISSGLGWSF
jgi:putative salt-induced outer membrane protein YdiY